MIKINLAQMKQSVSVGDSSTKRTVAVTKDVGLDLLRDPKVRQLLLLAVVFAGGYWSLEAFKEEELRKLNVTIQEEAAKTNKLNAEVTKTKGFEEIKKSLEEDELAIRTKIETIDKLMADRRNLPKAMQSVAMVIPQDVWLSDFKAEADNFVLKGYSLGYGQVSDFMRILGESSFFGDLKMASSQSVRDEMGLEITQFELGAKRK